jgi:hypothetical protein
MTDCTGTNCSSDSDDCHCFTTREVAGRMRPAQGRTIYPVDRELMQRDREIQDEIFRAKQQMKLWRR